MEKRKLAGDFFTWVSKTLYFAYLVFFFGLWKGVFSIFTIINTNGEEFLHFLPTFPTLGI